MYVYIEHLPRATNTWLKRAAAVSQAEREEGLEEAISLVPVVSMGLLQRYRRRACAYAQGCMLERDCVCVVVLRERLCVCCCIERETVCVYCIKRETVCVY